MFCEKKAFNILINNQYNGNDIKTLMINKLFEKCFRITSPLATTGRIAFLKYNLVLKNQWLSA